MTALLIPRFIVVHHTRTFDCHTHGSCQNEMRRIQNSHFAKRFNDIAYNFMVTASGVVYEGRGWYTQGETPSAPGLITRALLIAFHGTFDHQLPTARAMAAFRALIKCGKKMQVFGENGNPRIVGHRQLLATTSCPGTALYRYLMTWPEFESNPKHLLEQ